MPDRPVGSVVRMDNYTLNNGVEMPVLGFGVFQTPPDETRDAVRAALDAGYRHIDTAAAYGNEREVGEAVARLRRRPVRGLHRDQDLDQRLRVRRDAARLREERRQARRRPDRPADPAPGAARRSSTRPWTPTARWRPCCEQGKVRAIGVSNFMVDHLTRLLEVATVVPAVNQIEVHPYFQQREVQAFGAEHGILTQAWSPIGGITFYRDSGHTSTLEDPVIGKIADAHGKSPAQVMLRWDLQEGRR